MLPYSLITLLRFHTRSVGDFFIDKPQNPKKTTDKA